MISSFSGPYRFLSNFYPCGIVVEDKIYDTVEHAFQAEKTNSVDGKESIRLAVSPGGAKRLGRKVALRKDWEDVKDTVMYELVKQKFSTQCMMKALLDTGDEYLIEGNHWHDLYWGQCVCSKHKGAGENHRRIGGYKQDAA